jgi:uncharacterized membrane protein
MKINYVGLYLLAVGVFLIFDGIWLGVVAKNLYAKQLKGLMTDNVKWGAAALFYLLFIGFLIYFAIQPALQAQSLGIALQRGALFGLATYATYDLTNYATLKGFPLQIVVIDLVWGMFISGAVSAIAYTLYTKIF